MVELLRRRQHLVDGLRPAGDSGRLEQVGPVGEDLGLRLQRDRQDLAAMHHAVPGRLLEVGMIHAAGPGREVEQEALILAELRQVDRHDVVARFLVLRVQHRLLMQRVEGQDIELDLAARLLLHVIMHLLHGLEDRVADDDQADRLPVE